MKKRICLLALIALCTSLSGCAITFEGPNVLTWLLGVLGIVIILLALVRTYSIMRFNRHHSHKPLPKEEYMFTAMVYIAGLILLVLAFITLYAPIP